MVLNWTLRVQSNDPELDSGSAVHGAELDIGSAVLCSELELNCSIHFTNVMALMLSSECSLFKEYIKVTLGTMQIDTQY